jgi:hypothetical protein
MFLIQLAIGKDQLSILLEMHDVSLISRTATADISCPTAWPFVQHLVDGQSVYGAVEFPPPLAESHCPQDDVDGGSCPAEVRNRNLIGPGAELSAEICSTFHARTAEVAQLYRRTVLPVLKRHSLRQAEQRRRRLLSGQDVPLSRLMVTLSMDVISCVTS